MRAVEQYFQVGLFSWFLASKSNPGIKLFRKYLLGSLSFLLQNNFDQSSQSFKKDEFTQNLVVSLQLDYSGNATSLNYPLQSG